MRSLFSVLFTFIITTFAFSASISEIESILKNHSEKGYKFIKKLGDMSWKVSFGMDDWEEEVYVYVSQNANNRDFDIVYVYAGVKVYSDFSSKSSLEDIIYALERNASPAEWGSFSLYKEKDKWYLDYNVKLRRIYVDEVLLMNAIGWVAGATHNYKKEF